MSERPMPDPDAVRSSAVRRVEDVCDRFEAAWKAAAAAGAKLIREAITVRGDANIIVATGASQFEMLAALAGKRSTGTETKWIAW